MGVSRRLTSLVGHLLAICWFWRRVWGVNKSLLFVNRIPIDVPKRQFQHRQRGRRRDNEIFLFPCHTHGFHCLFFSLFSLFFY